MPPTQRGLAVMLDWVGNHTSFDHAWITQHPDWYVHDDAGNIVNPIPDWKDIAQLNWARPEVHAAMIQALRYWVFAANIDGYRFDYADGPSQEFFTEALANLRAIPKHKLLMLAEGDKKKYYLAGGFDLCYDFRLYERAEGRHICQRQERQAYRLGEYRQLPQRPGQRPDGALHLQPRHQCLGRHAGAAIWQPARGHGGLRGGGLHEGHAHDLQRPGSGLRRAGALHGCPRKAIDWTPNPALTREYQQLIRFRNGSAAVRNGALASYSSDDVCAFTKTEGKERVLVLANLRNAAVNYADARQCGSHQAGAMPSTAGPPASLASRCSPIST